MACKTKCNPLFDFKSNNFGQWRTATLYLRSSTTNDTHITQAQLQYPLSVQVLIKVQYSVGSDDPHQTSGVVQNGIVTHTFQLYKGVDLRMQDYSNPTVSLPNGVCRNILILNDFTSSTQATGIANVYTILNPDVMEDLAQPVCKILYCNWRGQLSKQASLRY